MTILVLQHHDAFPLTRLLQEADALGHRLRSFDIADGDIPSRDLAGVDALILGAGPFALSDAGEYPWMRRELDLCKAALDSDIPVFGVGFGARLLAHALGGQEENLRHEGRDWAEIGWGEVRFSEQALKAGYFRNFPTRLEVLHFHNLVVSLPPDASLLASSPLTPVQAFSHSDRHYGLLFHMEMVEADVLNLANVFSDTLEGLGLTRLTLGMDLLRRLQHLELYSSLFFGRLLEAIDSSER